MVSRPGVAKMFNPIKQEHESLVIKEKGVYSKKARAKLVEDGILNSEEEGFMEGYDIDEFMDDYDELDEEEFSSKGGEFPEKIY
jgi:hypothetical protein